MKNLFGKWAMWIVVFLLFILFVGAFYQHCRVNVALNQRYDKALDKIERTDSIIQEQLLSEETDLSQIKKTTSVHKYQVKDSLLKINDLKQFVFDNNTITFLVCAIIVLLGGIFLDIENRATTKIKQMKEKITETENKIKSFEKERNISQIYIKLQSLQSITLCYQFIIISNKYIINETINTIINQMFKTINDEKIIEIADNKTYLITKKIQNKIYKTISETIRSLELDKIHANLANKGKTNHIKELIDLLNDTLTKIEEIETVD